MADPLASSGVAQIQQLIAKWRQQAAAWNNMEPRDHRAAEVLRWCAADLQAALLAVDAPRETQPLVERDERGKEYPQRGASFREIAAHYFYDVMAAEDESRGCLNHQDPVHGGPLFCCQWRRDQPLCGDCMSVQRRIEDYAIDCIRAALRQVDVDAPQHEETNDDLSRVATGATMPSAGSTANTATGDR